MLFVADCLALHSQLDEPAALAVRVDGVAGEKDRVSAFSRLELRKRKSAPVKLFALCVLLYCTYRHVSHLQRRNDFIALFIGTGGDGVARVAVGVDDGVAPLPADDDGILAPGGTV